MAKAAADIDDSIKRKRIRVLLNKAETHKWNYCQRTAQEKAIKWNWKLPKINYYYLVVTISSKIGIYGIWQSQWNTKAAQMIKGKPLPTCVRPWDESHMEEVNDGLGHYNGGILAITTTSQNDDWNSPRPDLLNDNLVPFDDTLQITSHFGIISMKKILQFVARRTESG